MSGKAKYQEVIDMVMDARSRLVIDQVFFASLLSHLGWEIREDLVTANGPMETLCTNGKRIVIHPKFFASLDARERVTILAHEAWHAALCHPARMRRIPACNPMVANIAGDAIVNRALAAAGMKEPKCGWVRIPEIEEMTLEEAYAHLMKNPPSGGTGAGSKSGGQSSFGQFTSPNEMGGDDKQDGDGDGDEGGGGSSEAPEGEWAARISSALEAAKACGRMQSDLARIVNEEIQPRVDWRAVLRRFFEIGRGRDDYSFSRPSRRRVEPFILPGTIGYEPGEVVFSLDVSGSIDQQTAALWLGECASVLSEFPSLTGHVVTFDTRTHGPWPINAIPSPLPGGGGTSYKDIQDLAEKGGYKVHIVFTDGYCSDYRETELPTLWVLSEHPNSSGFNPPSGSIVDISGRIDR